MASSSLIADIGTVITNGPSTTTQANSIAAAGPINDYVGNCNNLLSKFKECDVAIAKLKALTDAGTDGTNRGLIAGVQALLEGTSSPSTAGLADLGTVYANGPSATTQSNAIAPAGPITDYPGMVRLCQKLLTEAKVLASKLVSVTDNGTDATNRGLLNGLVTALV